MDVSSNISATARPILDSGGEPIWNRLTPSFHFCGRNKESVE